MTGRDGYEYESIIEAAMFEGTIEEQVARWGLPEPVRRYDLPREDPPGIDDPYFGYTAEARTVAVARDEEWARRVIAARQI
jgi:hypothetical protein